MSDQNRLVLAYSGGLDTSVAISYLKERTGKDVVAVSLVGFAGGMFGCKTNDSPGLPMTDLDCTLYGTYTWSVTGLSPMDGE